MDDRKRNGILLVALVCAISLPASLLAQGSTFADDDFIATIRTIGSDAEIVRVPLGKSVMIDLNKPIVRASIASEDLAGVVVLSPSQIMVTGKEVGGTQLVLWNQQEEQKIFDVQVVMELPELKAIIRKAAPRAEVTVYFVRDTIVLIGSVPDSATAERLAQLAQVFSQQVINQLQVRGEQQVLLHCTVAEMSKRALRALGVNGFLAGKNFQDAFLVNNIAGINPTSIGPVLESGPFNVVNSIPFMLPRAGVGVGGVPTFSIGFPRLQMQLFVRAMRENGLLRILAEPNLACISGQTATFLAGGEFPVPVPQDQNTITIEYREFGVRLNFTPTVLGRHLVRLRVAPEVSELDFANAVQFAGFTIPGLTERKAETTVELADGQTMVMAGLLSEELRGTSQKIPGIGDLPIIGRLFSSVEFTTRTSELVILVSPEIIAPLNPEQVQPVPAEFVKAPNDWELFFLGQLEGKPDPPPTSAHARALDTEYPARVAPAKTGLAFRGPWGQSSTN